MKQTNKHKCGRELHEEWIVRRFKGFCCCCTWMVLTGGLFNLWRSFFCILESFELLLKTFAAAPAGFFMSSWWWSEEAPGAGSCTKEVVLVGEEWSGAAASDTGVQEYNSKMMIANPVHNTPGGLTRRALRLVATISSAVSLVKSVAHWRSSQSAASSSSCRDWLEPPRRRRRRHSNNATTSFNATIHETHLQKKKKKKNPRKTHWLRSLGEHEITQYDRAWGGGQKNQTNKQTALACLRWFYWRGATDSNSNDEEKKEREKQQRLRHRRVFRQNGHFFQIGDKLEVFWIYNLQSSIYIKKSPDSILRCSR